LIRVLVTITTRKNICLCYRLFWHNLMSFWLFDRWFIIVYSRFLFLMNSVRFIVNVMAFFNLMVIMIILVIYTFFKMLMLLILFLWLFDLYIFSAGNS